METTDVFTKEKFIAKLGELYVKDVYKHSNSVSFCKDRKDTIESLDNHSLHWLQDNVPGVKFIKITVTVEEHDYPMNELIF